MGVVVVVTPSFDNWFAGLLERDQDDVARVVGLLRSEGVLLGRPHSGSLESKKYAFRELRPRAGRSAIRVVYAFDPERNAVLILGASKASNSEKTYSRLIKASEKIWAEYLAKQQEKEES